MIAIARKGLDASGSNSRLTLVGPVDIALA
jgi:hypothetical protein